VKDGETLTLVRRETGEAGTPGYIPELSISTLELPWRNNKRLRSCIPARTYRVERRKHWRFGETFLVLNVPNRSGIYLHRANWLSQLLGCIALGWEHEFAARKKQWVLLESDFGFQRFMKLMEGVSWFMLKIENR